MRLLVVEDDVKMAALLRRGLQREGHAVDVADSGPQAIRAGTAFAYDAVQLDAMIPSHDGSKCAGDRAKRVGGCRSSC